MPRAWKAAFVRLFELHAHVRFLFKYDGDDIAAPANVLVRRWLPQRALLRACRVGAHVTVTTRAKQRERAFVAA